jgi:hypothetical protein
VSSSCRSFNLLREEFLSAPIHSLLSGRLIGPSHVATRVPLNLGTNKQPSEPKHTNMHNGNLHGLLPVLHRSDRWRAPVRPVTLVRLVDSAGQAGGYSSHTRNVPESLSDFCRPWIKNTPKTQPARKENPTQNLTNTTPTDQELTSSSHLCEWRRLKGF